MLRTIALSVLLLTWIYANAQESKKNPLMEDRFVIEVGVFIPSKSLKVGADGSSPNGEIDFSERFNLTDNEATVFFFFEWEFSKKWKFMAETFQTNSANRRTLDRDLEFGDFTIDKGTFARGGIEFDLYRIFFGRRVLDRENYRLGVGLGVHAVNLGAFIEGELRSSEGDVSFRTARVSSLIPLPNIGTWLLWSPHSKWLFGGRLDWFGLSIDEYSGGLWNIAPQVRFQIIENLGVGLDYRWLLLDANVDQSNWKGSFNMDFTGPLLTIHGNF